MRTLITGARSGLGKYLSEQIESDTLNRYDELLGIGESLAGFLIIYDGLSSTIRKITIKADPDCPLCGSSPRILDLSIHVK